MDTEKTPKPFSQKIQKIYANSFFVKILEFRAFWSKTIFGKFEFGKIPGFLEIGHFFCPFLDFSNTFAKQENPKNRYYSLSNLKKVATGFKLFWNILFRRQPDKKESKINLNINLYVLN
jgi:hypothetical protein